jgi:hypothetical protein
MRSGMRRPRAPATPTGRRQEIHFVYDSDVLIPGSRRLRAAHALDDRTGACPLIYDLERALLFDVPVDYQYHIQAVLETGELDEGLVGWLASVDLLTFERWTEPAAAGLGWGPPGGDALGGVFLAGGAVHCHPGAAEPSAEVLAFPFETLAEVPVVFHLTLGPGGSAALRRAVAAAVERAVDAARPVTFELTGNAKRLDDEAAELVTGQPFRVRLTCPPAGANGVLRGPWGRRLHERLSRLAAALGPRLTVHVRLGRHDRLGDLWRWAKAARLERLDATRVAGVPEGRYGSRSAEPQAFRADLAEVCDEMFEALGQSRKRPLLYEPVARVVRRMAGGAVAPVGDGVFLALVRDGRLIPCAPPLLGARPEPPSAAIELDLPFGEPCAGCWARYLCAHSLYARTAGTPAEKPREDRCELWRDEVAAALFFYRRLQEADPENLLGFPAAVPRTPAPAGEPAWPSPAEPRPTWVC